MWMLIAILQRASMLKRAVGMLNLVDDTCWMQVTQAGLVFGVQRLINRIPVELNLEEAGFNNYVVSHPLPNNEVFIELDVFGLSDILDLYFDDGDEIELKIPISWDKLCVTGGQLHQEEMLPVIRDDPYFSRAPYAPMERPFSYAIPANWLQSILSYSSRNQQDSTIWESNHIVATSCGAPVQRYIEKDFEAIPQNKLLLKFRFRLYNVLYFVRAIENANHNSNRVFMRMQDPDIEPGVPPSICVEFNNHSSLNFYILFDSIAVPDVDTISTLDVILQLISGAQTNGRE